MNDDLEFRVLAHEQILRAMIEHGLEAGSGLADHLAATFGHSAGNGANHLDRDSAAAYAARLVREVTVSGGRGSPPHGVVLPERDPAPKKGRLNLVKEDLPVRLEIRRGPELWELTRNGRLLGGYISRAGALEVAQATINEIAGDGDSIEMITRAPRDNG